jgi:hypothetical protein
MKKATFWVAALAVAGYAAACGTATSPSNSTDADRAASMCGLSSPQPGTLLNGTPPPGGSPTTIGGEAGNTTSPGGDGPSTGTGGKPPSTGSGGDGPSQGVVTGELSSVTGSCPSLTLKLGPLTVKTDASTSFQGITCGSVKANSRVGAVGTNSAGGTLQASCVAGL